jgi:hypothetical protein
MSKEVSQTTKLNMKKLGRQEERKSYCQMRASVNLSPATIQVYAYIVDNDRHKILTWT